MIGSRLCRTSVGHLNWWEVGLDGACTFLWYLMRCVPYMTLVPCFLQLHLVRFDQLSTLHLQLLEQLDLKHDVFGHSSVFEFLSVPGLLFSNLCSEHPLIVSHFTTFVTFGHPSRAMVFARGMVFPTSCANLLGFLC